MHLSLTELGTINKVIRLITSLSGIFLGGLWLTVIPLYRGLVIFTGLQSLSCLLFALLTTTGPNYSLITTAVFTEKFCSGLGNAALVMLLMSLCKKRYSATQYALLTSFAATGRVYLTPLGGYVVANTNWLWFFLIVSSVAFPVFFLIKYLKKDIDALSVVNNN